MNLSLTKKLLMSVREGCTMLHLVSWPVGWKYFWCGNSHHVGVVLK